MLTLKANLRSCTFPAIRLRINSQAHSESPLKEDWERNSVTSVDLSDYPRILNPGRATGPVQDAS